MLIVLQFMANIPPQQSRLLIHISSQGKGKKIKINKKTTNNKKYNRVDCREIHVYKKAACQSPPTRNKTNLHNRKYLARFQIFKRFCFIIRPGDGGIYLQMVGILIKKYCSCMSQMVKILIAKECRPKRCSCKVLVKIAVIEFSRTSHQQW